MSMKFKQTFIIICLLCLTSCIHNNMDGYDKINSEYFKGSYDDRHIMFDNSISKIYLFLEYCFWSSKYHNYRDKFNISDQFVFRSNNIIINGHGELITEGLGQFNYGNYFEIPKGSKLIIGNNVHISKYVTIYGAKYDDDGFINTGQINTSKSTTTIGDNVFIYPHVHIEGGVNIGNNVVIYANEFINKDIPDNTIVGG